MGLQRTSKFAIDDLAHQFVFKFVESLVGRRELGPEGVELLGGHPRVVHEWQSVILQFDGGSSLLEQVLVAVVNQLAGLSYPVVQPGCHSGSEATSEPEDVVFLHQNGLSSDA